MIIREADQIQILTDNGAQGDAVAEQELADGCLKVSLTADSTPVRLVRLRWSFAPAEGIGEPVKVLGDAWERSYGDLAWLPIQPERRMPWLCAISGGSDSNPDTAGRLTRCFGVKTQPNALCMWQLDAEGVTLWADVRCGGGGVLLGGRKLHVCDVVFGEYRDQTAFAALQAFCRLLSPAPLPVPGPIYGANNWYYAYGHSSEAEILADTALIARLCAGNEQAPFMVIDDGWQPNPCDGPWDRGNERFPDMKALREGIEAQGVRPGLWVRYLADTRYDTEGITPEMRSMRDPVYLDPSHPAVLEKIARDTRRFTQEWGYQLIKHDFTTYDALGFWGNQRPELLAEDGWHFYDRSKTSAEILLQLYRVIYENAAPGTILLGCNVIGHLAAGLVHLNRTGDDTSGVEWDRTRKMGINTLAFRLPQHRAFFDIDADCVGITGQIDWQLNRQWLELLACSGTPLFVSCQPDQCQGQVEQDLLAAFARGSRQADVLRPLDWMETSWPVRWLVNGQELRLSL